MPDMTIPDYEPDQLVAGDTATWRRQLDLYLASDGWTLSYALVQQKTGLRILITGTADGTDHLISVPGAVTAEWPDGTYSATGFCSKAADRFTIWRGTIVLLPNPAALVTGDPRTHAVKVLDAIQTVLEGRASQEVLEMTVEGVTLRKAAIKDLMDLRDRYEMLVQRERTADAIRSGRPTGRRILARFVSPA
jgi:hypothetical protein